MSTSLPLPILRLRYERSADEYLRSLPLEHFMEATAQATQRKITVESLDLVHARRPEVQAFNELLVQYPLAGDRIGKIVPDNMVVVHGEPIVAEGSFDLPFQPVGPYWVLEYVSKHTKRKDYDSSFAKYEKELKVPYYLMFVPDVQEMNLFQLKRGRYRSVRQNKNKRFAIEPLEMEMALEDGWVRYWYRGDLLPLPAELLEELDKLRDMWRLEKDRADKAEKAKLAAEEEVARLRAELQNLRRN